MKAWFETTSKNLLEAGEAVTITGESIEVELRCDSCGKYIADAAVVPQGPRPDIVRIMRKCDRCGMYAYWEV